MEHECAVPENSFEAVYINNTFIPLYLEEKLFEHRLLVPPFHPQTALSSCHMHTATLYQNVSSGGKTNLRQYRPRNSGTSGTFQNDLLLHSQPYLTVFFISKISSPSSQTVIS